MGGLEGGGGRVPHKRGKEGGWIGEIYRFNFP